MAYATAAEVKDKDLSRQVAQAAWVDSDVNDRIAEGDAVIDSSFSQMGYSPLPFSPVHAIIKRLSILYGKYACLRDMHHHFSPSQAGGEGYKGYKDQFDAIIKAIKDGSMAVVDAAGLRVEPTVPSPNMRVQINTLDVPRALDMGDPESQTLDGPAYSDPEVTGDPE